MKGWLALMAAFLAGCACTAVGCINAVAFQVGFAVERDVVYEVEACVDGLCTHASMSVVGPATQTGDTVGALTLWEDADRLDLDLGHGDFSGSHEVALTIRDASGAALVSWSETVEMQRSQPNGPWCDPTCWYAEVEVGR